MRTNDWHDVCGVHELVHGGGIAVRVGDTAIAVFLDPDDGLHALDHVDPLSGAEVIAWGILGERDGEWYVAAPLYKQKYRLRDGRCIDGDAPDLGRRAIRIVNGRVQIGDRMCGLPHPATLRDGVAAATLSA